MSRMQPSTSVIARFWVSSRSDDGREGRTGELRGHCGRQWQAVAGGLTRSGLTYRAGHSGCRHCQIVGSGAPGSSPPELGLRCWSPGLPRPLKSESVCTACTHCTLAWHAATGSPHPLQLQTTCREPTQKDSTRRHHHHNHSYLLPAIHHNSIHNTDHTAHRFTLPPLPRVAPPPCYIIVTRVRIS